MKITLEIPDNKVKFFLQFIKELTFIKVAATEELVETDWWDTVSDTEKAAIQKGVQQLDAGQGIPHEEVMKKVAKKLNRSENE